MYTKDEVDLLMDWVYDDLIVYRDHEDYIVKYDELEKRIRALLDITKKG